MLLAIQWAQLQCSPQAHFSPQPHDENSFAAYEVTGMARRAATRAMRSFELVVKKPFYLPELE